jgi:hypothetical protein
MFVAREARRYVPYELCSNLCARSAPFDRWRICAKQHLGFHDFNCNCNKLNVVRAERAVLYRMHWLVICARGARRCSSIETQQ